MSNPELQEKGKEKVIKRKHVSLSKRLRWLMVGLGIITTTAFPIVIESVKNEQKPPNVPPVSLDTSNESDLFSTQMAATEITAETFARIQEVIRAIGAESFDDYYGVPVDIANDLALLDAWMRGNTTSTGDVSEVIEHLESSITNWLTSQTNSNRLVDLDSLLPVQPEGTITSKNNILTALVPDAILSDTGIRNRVEAFVMSPQDITSATFKDSAAGIDLEPIDVPMTSNSKEVLAYRIVLILPLSEDGRQLLNQLGLDQELVNFLINNKTVIRNFYENAQRLLHDNSITGAQTDDAFSALHQLMGEFVNGDISRVIAAGESPMWTAINTDNNNISYEAYSRIRDSFNHLTDTLSVIGDRKKVEQEFLQNVVDLINATADFSQPSADKILLDILLIIPVIIGAHAIIKGFKKIYSTDLYVDDRIQSHMPINDLEVSDEVHLDESAINSVTTSAAQPLKSQF